MIRFVNLIYNKEIIKEAGSKNNPCCHFGHFSGAPQFVSSAISTAPSPMSRDSLGVVAVFVGLLLVSPSCGGEKQLTAWVVPTTTAVRMSVLPPRGPLALTAPLALQRGEAEGTQLALRVSAPSPVTATVTLSNVSRVSDGTLHTKSGAPAATMPTLRWYKVGNVWCNKSTIYGSVTGTGWQPDVLVPAEYFDNAHVILEPNTTHAFWIDAHATRNATPGNYTANVTLTFLPPSTLPPQNLVVLLTVWQVALTPLSDAGSFPTMFNMPFREDADGATDLARYYNASVLPQRIQQAYFDTVCDSRVPADDPYLLRPRPLGDYKSLAACGARQFNLLDVSRAATNGTVLRSYTPAQIDATLNLLAPIVAALDASGLGGRALVYGFDERDTSYAPGIRQMFGAVKARFPSVRTVATLRWAPGSDLNVDVWVQLYSLWDSAAARAFNGSTWAYHCISPRPNPPASGPVRFANTFLEYPRFDARGLGWWAGYQGVDGWLYYLVNGWSQSNQHRAIDGLTGANTAHTPADDQSENEAAGANRAGRAGASNAGHGSCCTWFSAVRPNAKAVPGDPGAFSNGDGIFIYPGRLGPLASTRLFNLRDGFEDLEMLRQLARIDPDQAHALASKIVQDFVPEASFEPAHRDASPGLVLNRNHTLLEATRHALAAALAKP
eukprot:m.401097 g.401097  ORF g.401097 m.401097 type:complete len:667 (-) comp20115_c5_seq4:125-2125(-)